VTSIEEKFKPALFGLENNCPYLQAGPVIYLCAMPQSVQDRGFVLYPSLSLGS
jgi:hypothetical protein